MHLLGQMVHHSLGRIVMIRIVWSVPHFYKYISMPSKLSSIAGNQWIQFDVGPPTLVTGLMTKGRGDGGKKHWVTRFRVSYSNDSAAWFYYKDASHLDLKVGWHSLGGHSSEGWLVSHSLGGHWSYLLALLAYGKYTLSWGVSKFFPRWTFNQ